MTSNQTSGSQLTDILASAVDRQVAEQRAIQSTLDGLRAAVADLRATGAATAEVDSVRGELRELKDAVSELGRAMSAGQPTPPPEGLDDLRRDLAGLREEISVAVEVASEPSKAPEVPVDVLDAIREALEGVRASLDERVEQLPSALFKGVKDAIVPQLGTDRIVDSIETLSGRWDTTAASQRDEIRSALQESGRDVQALAHAVLDLSTSLRTWMEDFSDRMDGLNGALLQGLGDLASRQEVALEELAGSVGEAVASFRRDVREAVEESSAAVAQQLEGIGDKMAETEDVSKYLRDQTDDLDKVIAGIGDVPERLEAVVAQALRRALTVRAGLVREAEKALERTITPVSQRLETLVDALDAVAGATEDGGLGADLRKLGLRHVELASRMDDLQSSLIERVDDGFTELRERDIALAQAIDRIGEGAEPRAAAALEESPSRPATSKKRATKKAGSKKTASKKPTSPAPARGSSSKKSAPKKSTRKKSSAKKSTSKKSGPKKPTRKKSSAKKSTSKRSASKESASKKSGRSSTRRGSEHSKRSSGRSSRQRSGRGDYIPV